MSASSGHQGQRRHSRWVLLLVVTVATGLCLTPPIAWSDDHRPRTAPTASALFEGISTGEDIRLIESPEWLQRYARQLVIEHLPLEHEEDDEWGHQGRRFDGLSIRRDGLRLKTKRRWKDVNHGLWKRYSIKQLDPEKHLQLRLRHIEAQEGAVRFDLELTTKLFATARRARWTKGVQLYSVEVAANADVRLGLTCELRIEWITGHVPPDIQLIPTVLSAELELLDYDVRRVSKLDGPGVHGLGEALRSVVDAKLSRTNEQLASKLNRQLAKQEEELRFSPSKLFAAFGPREQAQDGAELPAATMEPTFSDEVRADADLPLLIGPANSD